MAILRIRDVILWVAAYFGIMLFYTSLNVAIWRRAFPDHSQWINTAVIAICSLGFIWLLKRRYEIALLSNITPMGILCALLCSVLFFLVLDHLLDPVLEDFFPQSEQAYRKSLQDIINAPAAGLLRVCIIAPVVEEILMRGFVLGGLRQSCGVAGALLLSALLFAILHFNMVQTLSAFLCGIVLGLLYIKTDSLPCCIIAHCGYNLISFVAAIQPHIEK